MHIDPSGCFIQYDGSFLIKYVDVMLAKKRSTKDCGWNQVGCSDHLEVDLIDGVYDDAQDRSFGNKVVMFLRKFTRKYKKPKFPVKPKRQK